MIRLPKIIATHALVAVVFLSFALVGCGDKPSQGDCEKLLDHFIEIEVTAAGTDQLTPEMQADLDKQKKGVREQVKKAFMEQCTEKTPGSFVKCGLKARNAEALAKCK